MCESFASLFCCTLCFVFVLQTSREFSGKDEALKSIPQFCFPDIDQWKPTKSYQSESYSFVLTDMEGNRRYGYCRRLLVRVYARMYVRMYVVEAERVVKPNHQGLK